MDQTELLKTAIMKAGSQKALAVAIDVVPSTISNWKSKGSFNADAEHLLRSFLAAERPSASPRLDEQAFTTAHGVYAKAMGLEFGRVTYSCCLEPSKSGNPEFADAQIEVVYSDLQVHPAFGRVRLQLRAVSDGSSSSAGLGTVEVLGPGVTYDSTDSRSQHIELIQRRSLGESLDQSTGKIARIHTLFLNESVDPTSQIRLRRTLRDGFALSEAVAGLERIQYAGYKVERPTRTLQLSLAFAPDLLADVGAIPVEVYAWGPWSLDMRGIDFRKTTAFLIQKPCRPEGLAKWTWESTSPPVLGMIYGLAYDTLFTSRSIHTNL